MLLFALNPNSVLLLVKTFKSKEIAYRSAPGAAVFGVPNALS